MVISMKASRFLGNKTFAVADLPTPHAGPGELVLRNQVCGVCGTDVHIYHGEPGSADVNPPVVLGHETPAKWWRWGRASPALRWATTSP